MDANGQRFWLLAGERDWHPVSHVQYDRARRGVRLASERVPPAWIPSRIEATARLQRIPEARDGYGTFARWDTVQKKVMAGGAVPGEVPVASTPGRAHPTDLCLGHDGVLYLAGPFGVTLHDRRNDRESRNITLTGFVPWRIAADPGGGVWVLDAANRALAKVEGGLWADRPYGPYAPGVFRPFEENPDPPRLLPYPDATLPGDEEPAGIACSPGGRVAVLTWAADGVGVLRTLEGFGWSAPVRLSGASYPYSLAWVSEDRVAVMVPNAGEAPAYSPVPREDGEDSLPVGDLYPLRDHDGDPFVHTLSLPAHYPTRHGHEGLHRLSLPSFARAGEAGNLRLLDSFSTQTVWHRVYLEAAVPPGCGVVLRLAASDDPAAPLDDAEWHEHRFGPGFRVEADGAPVGSWVPFASELPFHPGLMRCDREEGESGLWTALVQRAGRTVRSLRGRYLWVRAELRGNGRTTPEVAAVRVYGSRFSYVESYLPELYRETAFGPDADRPSPRATPADFLERFLGLFEGVLTPLEDRIAHAWMLTDPEGAPDDALEWLASWIGFSMQPGMKPERRRAMLRAAPELAKRHGTLPGLALALEVATGGAVSGGEIVILEDFRLRRTFATILGADLAPEEDDPLTGGLAVSGNSYVGDTLFLGDESRREFLALFDEDLKLTKAEQDAVAALFERLAHRVTVLVHQRVDPQDLGLISRVMALETPAHVQGRVLAATHPFLVGMASLVGVDTYLAPRPAKSPVRVNRSYLGVRDYLITPVSLDPRLEGGVPRLLEPPTPPPVADLGPAMIVERGHSFDLDGSGSSATEPRTLDWFRWRRLE